MDGIQILLIHGLEGGDVVLVMMRMGRTMRYEEEGDVCRGERFIQP
jgi:hypothetical protein